jgi:hypothetical protein
MWVRGLCTTLVLALLLFLGAAAFAQDEEDFEPGTDENLSWVSYDEAVSQAKTDYKPVMLYFYGRDGEDLCKMAEKQIFKGSAVKSQAKKFAVVKLSSTNNETMTEKYSVPPGQFAIVILNFQLKELARVDSEKDLKKLSSIMSKMYSENSDQNKKLKKVAEYYNTAMKYRDAKRMRECVQILEGIVALRGEIDSPYIAQADEYLKQLEKAGSEALSQADELVKQAESSLWQARTNGSRYFRQEYVTRAQEKLIAVARDYPVQSLMKRRTDIQTRLAQVSSEYQKLVQEEQEREKKQNP